MIHRYVKPLDVPVFEATNPAESAFNAVKQKYDGAVKKDQESYGQYTKGAITKDQYLQSFEQFLQIEQEYRRAQVNYKLESARGDAQQADKNAEKKPETPGNAPGNQPGTSEKMTASNLPG